MVEKKDQVKKEGNKKSGNKEKIGVNATEHEWKYKSSKNLHHEL
jgi:hypothetical protein